MRGKKHTTKSKRQTKKKKSTGQKHGSMGSKRRRGSPGIDIPPVLEPESDDTLTETAGQAGDIEGLTGFAIDDSESVRELVEEGQDFEAELVDAIENAPEADKPLKVHRRKSATNNG